MKACFISNTLTHTNVWMMDLQRRLQLHCEFIKSEWRCVQVFCLNFNTHTCLRQSWQYSPVCHQTTPPEERSGYVHLANPHTGHSHACVPATDQNKYFKHFSKIKFILLINLLCFYILYIKHIMCALLFLICYFETYTALSFLQAHVTVNVECMMSFSFFNFFLNSFKGNH